MLDTGPCVISLNLDCEASAILCRLAPASALRSLCPRTPDGQPASPQERPSLAGSMHPVKRRTHTSKAIFSSRVSGAMCNAMDA